MKKTTLVCLATAFATLTAVVSAHAQASVLFSGGNGARLNITLLQPVTYTINVNSGSGDAPFFVLDGAGNNFASFPSFTGTISFSTNGGANQIIDTVASGFASNDLTADDTYLFGILPGVRIGDKVVLNAGTLTTTDAFAGPAPAGGNFSTFIAYGDGRRLSTFGNSVPEPSTWAILGAGGVGLALRRRYFRA